MELEKTTLVRVLLGLMSPTEGNIYIEPSLRIGYVPQNIGKDFSLSLSVKRFLQLKIKVKKIIFFLFYNKEEQKIN
ncbi:MAG: hypothetical protein V9822_00005 [Candidatus Dasytiphilus stammeri]